MAMPSSRGHRITDWHPDDTAAWEAGNSTIARRNLVWSTATMHIAFSVWSLWPVMMLFMPESVYGLGPGDKLLLGATATLVGGAVRIPYAVASAKFGGRNWAAFSSLILLIPTIGALLLMLYPGQPLWQYVVCAALTGLGGGNYSAALAHVEAFYPRRLKGFALGLCGGIGNLGVAAIQLVGLLVLSFVGNQKPYLVCAIYLVFVTVVGIGASMRMDNLDHTIEIGHLRTILTVPDTWSISVLYSAAFGSFIGFAFAFVQVLHVNFEHSGQTAEQAALHTAQIAFVGPLVGALARIYGGRLADRRGGGHVTFWTYVGMIVATAVLAATSTHYDHTAGQASETTMVVYIASFIVLFALSGIGNGSVLKLIPWVFEERSKALVVSDAERRHWARSHSGALIGFATAVGALGGVGINMTFRHAYAAHGTETSAFWVFLGCYIGALALTWVIYVRKQPATSR